MTIIHSNGSKWAGESPDSIDKLTDVLGTETIEEHFFSTYTITERHERVIKNHCPISVEGTMMLFFGNFEKLSHVFRIETNDDDVIEKLGEAITKNAGWLKYYEKNLLKN